jgi:cytochrome c oxidase assembly protein subunit 15
MNKNEKISSWLALSAIMVIIMVFVGGWTRLADAGLSIVEWKPITGIIPPMNDLDWNLEFDKYKNSPEFEQIHNYFMLSDFKKIFWLEFIHRIFGRVTGMAILLPALFFWYKGMLRDYKPYVTMIVLVGFQGFMGWWMVKSGLVEDPHVSHFRLAAHLITAMCLYSVIFWEWLEVRYNYKNIHSLGADQKANVLYLMSRNDVLIIVNITILLLFAQIFLGALVAGLDAGMIYNTFPLMGNSFIPSEFDFSWYMLYDPASVQFLHRCVAYLLAIVALILAYRLPKKFGIMLIITVSLQILLGICTVVYVVPIYLALIHQLFAVFLLSLVLYIRFVIGRESYE